MRARVSPVQILRRRAWVDLVVVCSVVVVVVVVGAPVCCFCCVVVFVFSCPCIVVLFLSVVVVVALSVGRCCCFCSVVVAVGRLGCTPGLQAIPMSMVIFGVCACVRLKRRRQGEYSERLCFPCPFLHVSAENFIHHCSFECLAMGRQDRP